jgi:hypothetical protein
MEWPWGVRGPDFGEGDYDFRQLYLGGVLGLGPSLPPHPLLLRTIDEPSGQPVSLDRLRRIYWSAAIAAASRTGGDVPCQD